MSQAGPGKCGGWKPDLSDRERTSYSVGQTEPVDYEGKLPLSGEDLIRFRTTFWARRKVKPEYNG